MTQARDRTEPWRWAMPPKVNLPPDELRARIDIHNETIVLRIFDKGAAVVRPVSALDVAQAFFTEIPLSSGFLPEGALWWSSGREAPEVALWLPPKVWPVAAQLEAFKPARRLRLPMPGLVFVCQPSRAPRVYAAERRPASPLQKLYHAPLFNVFQDGRTCAGTQRYGPDIGKHPWEFMASFFTHATHVQGRSKRHPKDLLALWEEMDGKPRFPLSDLLPCGTVADLMPGGLK